MTTRASGVLLAAAGVASVVGLGVWLVMGDVPPVDDAADPVRAADPEAPGDGSAADAPRTRRHVEVAAKAPVVAWSPPGWDRAVALHAEGRSAEALRLISDLRRVHIDFFERPEVAALVAAMEAAVPEDAARREAAERGAQESVEGASAEERAVVARHLARFGLAGSGSAEGWADDAVRRAVDARAVPAVPKTPLAVAAATAEVERRRVEQIRKVRERGVVEVLDPIHAGLAWLALHQGEDGGFGDQTTEARCEALEHDSCLAGTGVQKYDLAATALAVLAFLDFRDQDARGTFEPNLSAGVRWLQGQVRDDGSFRGSSRGYERGIALLALGQATAASDEPELGAAVERAWKHAAGTAGPRGGYRYSLTPSDGDLSVTGWYVQAYEVARDAGVQLPVDLAARLTTFTRSSWAGESEFMYLPGQGARASLASVGMLSMAILGQDDAPGLREQWMATLDVVPDTKFLNLYGLYYDVRIDIFLRGAPVPARRDVLLEFAREWQTQEGDALGRFWTSSSNGPPSGKVVDPKTGKRKKVTARKESWVTRGGPTVFTAFAVLTLEHALYRR